jgi:hypothetical protein|nr:MAG TPA: hypothetical protein [Caudoviricetes sp.]
MAPKNKRSASNVTYNVTEEQMENMIRKASEAGIKAGIEAYKTEYKETARRKVDRMLYKTKVLLEKYRYLTEYADQSVYTLKKAEEVNESIADIEALTKFGIFDDDKTLHNLKRGVMTVNMLMTHVNNMLEVYRKSCESSSSPIKQRQYRVIYHMYLAEEKKTTKEIAEMEKEELRTIQNDAKAAREDLTALIFGLDGILVRILRE